MKFGSNRYDVHTSGNVIGIIISLFFAIEAFSSGFPDQILK